MIKDHLGIYFGHNGTAALIRDGKVLSCMAEERFTGKKNQIGYPV
jgi:predicted NodU family carbamoyl transferase